MTSNDEEIVIPHQLNAHGRTLVGHVEGRAGKRGNTVDGARFESYDPETKTIKIRIDDSQVPEFWLEVHFTTEQLDRFMKEFEEEEEDDDEEEERRKEFL